MKHGEWLKEIRDGPLENLWGGAGEVQKNIFAPPPPHNFSNGPSLTSTEMHVRPFRAFFGANLIEQPLCRSVYYNCTLECRKG